MVATTRSQVIGKAKTGNAITRPGPITAKTKSKPKVKPATSQEQPTPSPSMAPATVLPIMYHLLSRLSSDSSTICPSQVARKLHESDSSTYPDWRALMYPIRDMVWAEAETGRVEITQGGVVRSVEERDRLKGPIRVRRGPEYHTTLQDV